MVPVAARAADVASLDSPFVRFQDPDELGTDAARARRMGYTGKFAIHPAQLGVINKRSARQKKRSPTPGG